MEQNALSAGPLQAYYRSIRSFDVLGPAEEKALATKYQQEKDLDAARRLVTSNVRLVIKIAYEHGGPENDLLDLIQEGNTGLILAVSKFDPNKGVKFSSYASWWIRAYILKYLLSKARLVKLGTTQAQRRIFYNLGKEKARIEAMGLELSTEEIADRLGVKTKEVEEMEQRLNASDLSLDFPMAKQDGGEGRTLYDELPSPHMSTEELLAHHHERCVLKEQLRAFGGKLTGRERFIFENRMMTDSPMTLQKIGEEFGVSRERIRQIEMHLIRRLRERLSKTMNEHYPMELAS